MKKIIILFLLLSVMLDNAKAIETIEMPMSKANKIVVELMFYNGSKIDPSGKEGLTNLTLSTIMGGGTLSKKNSELSYLTEPWGARYYGMVDKEVSIMMFEVLSTYADQFQKEIISGLVLSPSFSEDDFNRAKSNQQNYVDQVIRSNSDEEYAKLWLEDMIFRGTTYQHTIAGTSTSVKSITLDDVKNHYKKYFTNGNVTVGIAGSFTEKFKSTLLTNISNLPSKTFDLTPSPKGNIPTGLNVEIISKEGALGSAISAGFPMAVTRSNDEFAALIIANSWLGEHRKSYSKLYQKIREARSMNYGDYTYIEWYKNGGGNMLPPFGTPRKSNYFSIWVRPVQTAESLKNQYEELKDIKTGHAHFALRMVMKEMDALINNGMTQQAFEETRNFLSSYMKLYQQNLASQLGYRMDAHFYGRKDYIGEMIALFSKLTLEDVNKTIKKYWQTKNMHIAIVTDVQEATALRESFLTGAISPMSYSNGLKNVLNPAILEEDKIVERYPLPIKTVNIIPNAETFKINKAEGGLKIIK